MIILNSDERTAEDQLADRYAHGGGYAPFDGFTLSDWGWDAWADGSMATMIYAGDPPVTEVSRAALRDQTLILFEHSWLAIIEKDGSFTVTRVD